MFVLVCVGLCCRFCGVALFLLVVVWVWVGVSSAGFGGLRRVVWCRGFLVGDVALLLGVLCFILGLVPSVLPRFGCCFVVLVGLLLWVVLLRVCGCAAWFLSGFPGLGFFVVLFVVVCGLRWCCVLFSWVLAVVVRLFWWLACFVLLWCLLLLVFWASGVDWVLGSGSFAGCFWSG